MYVSDGMQLFQRCSASHTHTHTLSSMGVCVRVCVCVRTWLHMLLNRFSCSVLVSWFPTRVSLCLSLSLCVCVCVCLCVCVCVCLDSAIGHCQPLALPFHVCGTIVVPNLTKPQKTIITNVLRRILHTSTLKAYERQALKHSVRIVRSNPHTVRSLFRSHAMSHVSVTRNVTVTSLDPAYMPMRQILSTSSRIWQGD